MQICVIAPKKGTKVRKLNVGAYVRVSTESLEQEDSLDNQKTYYRGYISRNPKWKLVDIYADQGISGFKENRPDFQRMIADAKAGKLDLIVVKSVSRFARNTETVLKFSRELKSIGVGIFFELQNINTLSGSGELMLTILAAFAQAESEGASDNAYMTYKRKFSSGIPAMKLKRTYGFDEDSEGNTVINEAEAQTIRLIFSLAERGIWPSKIRRHLNEQGIPVRSGGQWDDTAIFRILKNPAYKGDLLLQKTYLDSNRVRHTNNGEREQWYIVDDHPCIVTPKQWDAVQEVLQHRTEKLAPKAEHKPAQPKSYSGRYPLTDKLYCPYCGEKLIHKWTNNGKSEYWQCKKNLKVSSKSCKGVWLPAAVAAEWGSLDEPTTVIDYEDEFGMRRFTAYPKEEFEASDDCPYLRKETAHGQTDCAYPCTA